MVPPSTAQAGDPVHAAEPADPARSSAAGSGALSPGGAGSLVHGERRVADRSDEWPALWVATAVLALAFLAMWQGSPGWWMLGAALMATILSAVVAVTSLRRLGRAFNWATAALIALTLTLGIAANETRKLQIIAATYEAYSVADMDRRVQRMSEAVHETADILAAASDRLLGELSYGEPTADSAVPSPLSDPATASASLSTASSASASAVSEQDGTPWQLAPATGADWRRILALPSLPGSTESAILVFRDGVLVAHEGQTRVPVTTGEAGVQVVRTAFHTAMLSHSISPDHRTEVVAVALLASLPPADRFAHSLAQYVTNRYNAPRVTFEAADSAFARRGSSMLYVIVEGEPVVAVRALPFSEGETRVLRMQMARARTAAPLAVAVFFVLIVSWRRPALTRHRLLSLSTILGVVAIAPLSALSNVSPLFDAASFFAPVGGALTANVAALLLTATLILAALLLRLRGRGLATRRSTAALLVIVVAALGPFLLRDLARGITLPASGADYWLWTAWQLAIALTGVGVLLAGAAAGQVTLGKLRGVPPVVAPLIAIAAAMLAPILWQAPGVWPDWYILIWIAAIGALALTRASAGALVVAATFVAGCGAVTLTWGAVARERVDLAAFDVARISAVDENAFQLLQRFAMTVENDTVRLASPDALLRQYAASELAMAGYPARLARWTDDDPDYPLIDVALAPVTDTIGAQAAVAHLARASGVSLFHAVEDGAITYLIAAIPARDGTVTTIAVPPRTRMLPLDPFAALTGIAGDRNTEPPYQMRLGGAPASNAPQELQWTRSGNIMRAVGVAGMGERSQTVNIEVDLRGLSVLLPRGALLVLLDVGVVLLIWAATAAAEGALGPWLNEQYARILRSYRMRLSATLIVFFVAPATIFAGWSAFRLRDDDRVSRELLLREALRDAVAGIDDRSVVFYSDDSERVPYFLFEQSQLVAASDPVLDALAPLGRLLPAGVPLVHEDPAFADDDFVSRRVEVRSREALVGYRELEFGSPALVLATPARGNESELDKRREDLGILVLFASALGVLAAFWFSGLAARALARPVSALRHAALSLASGDPEPQLGAVPATEFASVYGAFTSMAHDLTASRAELEASHRRTEAVLQHVASGVVALRTSGEILLVNPRALSILVGTARGEHLIGITDLPQEIRLRTQAFLQGQREEEAFEVQVDARQLRVRLTRLPSGAVLTVDDVTEMASAQRVLAWGEMARQVAHEIKNPLTPIRLGVQHLRRAFRDERSDFGGILETNVGRILSEIDHLDEIARSFSRYGSAPEHRAATEPVDVVSVVKDMISLEELGGTGGTEWIMQVQPEGSRPMGLARRDDLREVVLNLLENSRLAGSTTVCVGIAASEALVVLEVTDNGSGISKESMSRIFEPHFSTRTSGSGLGLAICRQLVEGWGGRITVANAPGGGTVARVEMSAAGSTSDYPSA